MLRSAATDPHPIRRHTRRLRRLIGVAVAAALLAACTNGPATRTTRAPLPQLTGTARSAPRTPPPSSPATTSPVRTPDVDTPPAVTIRWLAAYRTATWTDPGPAAWIDRVRPYVTDAMHTRNTSLHDGNAGIDWADFVDQHCESTVSDLAAVVPAEAPGTATAANVLVTGTVNTTCTAGAARPVEQATATLVVIATSTGWRVDHGCSSRRTRSP